MTLFYAGYHATRARGDSPRIGPATSRRRWCDQARCRPLRRPAGARGPRSNRDRSPSSGGWYYFPVRAGDLLGAWIYDGHGGFIRTLVVTIAVYVLILPVILLVPRRLTRTRDGEALDAA